MSDLAEYKRSLALGPIDRKLLRGAADGLSPKEIANVVGNVLTPEQCADRVKNLIGSRDWLNPLEKEALVLDQMNELVENLRQASQQGHTRSIEVAASILGKKLDYLQKNRMSAEDAAQIIQEGHARLMLEAISRSYELAAELLSERFPDVPAHELRDTFMQALPVAIEQVEGHVA